MFDCICTLVNVDTKRMTEGPQIFISYLAEILLKITTVDASHFEATATDQIIHNAIGQENISTKTITMVIKLL